MTGWLLSATVLVAAVLVLRRVLRRHLHPAALYALWLLAAARLLLPFTVGTSALSLDAAASSLPLVRQAEALLPADTADPLTPAVLESHPLQDSAPAEDNTPETAAVPWTKVITAVWIGGSAVTLAWLLAVNGRCYARLRRSRRPLDAGRDLPCHVYVSPAIDTPCLFGRGIYVTPQVAADETALRHVLAHEATHYRHGDPLWAVVRGACLVVHWWNPLVWLAAIRSREDGELACDACAVKRLGEEERTAYGRTLIALSCAQTRPVSPLTVATTLSGGKRTLKERVCLLAKQPHTRAAAAFVLAAAVILAAVAGFTGEKSGVTIRLLEDNGEVARLSITGSDDSRMVLLFRQKYFNGQVSSLGSYEAELPVKLNISVRDDDDAATGDAVTYFPLPSRQEQPGIAYVWSAMQGTVHVEPGSVYPIAWCGYSEDGNIDALRLDKVMEDPTWFQQQKGTYFVIWAAFPRDASEAERIAAAIPDSVVTGVDEIMPPDAQGRKLTEMQTSLFTTNLWYTQALTSTYDDPRDVDLSRMFYNGGSRQPTQEEYDYVQQLLDYPGTDVLVITPQEMDQALWSVFGLRLTETHLVGLDQFIWREDTGCYYLCHGDTNAMSVTFTAVEELGGGRTALTYPGWDGDYTVTLNGSRIESHVKAG